MKKNKMSMEVTSIHTCISVAFKRRNATGNVD